MLPAAQRALWPELSSTPDSFVLYGGTALALRLGHRHSVDFDFFAFQPIDPTALKALVPYLDAARIIESEPNTLTCLVDRSGPVKVSFFGLPNIRPYQGFGISPDNGLKVAGLLDIAGTKAQTVQARAAAKDYIDIDALITSGIPLTDHLEAARVMFGSNFEPLATLKALSYFGDVPDLDLDVRERLLKAVDAIDAAVNLFDQAHEGYLTDVDLLN
ncbi:MAG: nucleotidyl transferase AbiEii/AbiGii toxin family protein, partial [Proteobacteria bacterium]|nr:nucleotidyl transferase AbiEii/AbiGii toxin family protein [Pseudomonadota bacterium]